MGGGLYLAALAVLSVAAGASLRHPAAAIARMMAVVLVLAAIAQALPDSCLFVALVYAIAWTLLDRRDA